MIRFKRFHFQPYLTRGAKSFKQNIQKLRSGSNNSRIIGTIAEVHSPVNNNLMILVNTYDDKQFYSCHRAFIPNYKVENFPKLKQGQKVYVFGSIRAEKFKRIDGTEGTALATVANLIYVCESDEMPMNLKPSILDPVADVMDEEAIDAPNFVMNDLNYVEINAPICFHIQNKEKFSVFSMASQHFKENVDGIKELHVDFIPIFVYDEELRNYVRNHLKRLDCVRVEGVFKYRNEMNAEGKQWKGGYISANKIVKVVSAHKLVSNQKDTSPAGLKVKKEINRRSNIDIVKKKS